MTPPSSPSLSPEPKPIGPRTSSPRPPFPSAHQPRRWRRTWLLISAAVAVILLTGGWLMYRAIAVINTQKDGSRLGFFQQLTHIVTARGDELNGEQDDRVNLLLMGIGGPGHDGPYLTDTLMVASYQPSTKRVAFISIPRDLVVDIPGYDYRKINNVLSIGRDRKYPGGGEALVAKIVGNLLDLPIQYYARVDFEGFSETIDRLGGVTVTVDHAFTDSEYPTENYGYQTVRFAAGEQTMTGATALKFARSRHGNNGEGSDFARAARQQKILLAMRQKVLSIGTLLNPVKVSDILGALGSHSQTNMEVWEMLRLGTLAKDFDTNAIINLVLHDREGGLLRSATGSGGAYILVPRARDYSDIAYLANHIFSATRAATENAPVSILNGSKIPAVGETIYSSLDSFGLDMKRLQATTAITQTILIDASAGAFPTTAALIKDFAKVKQVLSPVAYAEATGDRSIFASFEPPASQPDAIMPKFLLILGTDQPTPPRSIFSTATQTTNTNSTTNKNTNKNSNTNKSTNKNTNTNTNLNRNTNSSVNTNTNINTNTSVNTNQSINTNS